MRNAGPGEERPAGRTRVSMALLVMALVIGTGCGGSAQINSTPLNLPPMFDQTVTTDPAVNVAAISPAQTNVNANPGGDGGGAGPLVYGDPLDDQFQGDFDPYNPTPEQQDPPPADFYP